MPVTVDFIGKTVMRGREWVHWPIMFSKNDKKLITNIFVPFCHVGEKWCQKLKEIRPNFVFNRSCTVDFEVV